MEGVNDIRHSIGLGLLVVGVFAGLSVADAQSIRMRIAYPAGMNGSIPVTMQQPKASAWFGERLRLDPNIIRHASMDDPNRSVGTLAEIQVNVTPSADWVSAAYEFGMIRARVD